MDRKHVKILGIKVSSTRTSSVLREVVVSIKKHKKFYIVTPNPEQVLQAQEDSEYASILNNADIALCDGVGLAAAYRFLSLPKSDNPIVTPILYFAQGLGVGFSIIFDRNWLTRDLQVLKGREMFIDLIKLANKKRWRVHLLGGWDKVAERTKLELEKNYKNLFLSAGTGPVLKDDGTPENDKERKVEKEVIQKINELKPHLLFIGFRSPVQEKWLVRWFKKLDIGGAMVVGGTFNYFSGKSKLPPVWVSDIGFEWLWRLITGSQRKERVLRAFLNFPLKVFSYKISK